MIIVAENIRIKSDANGWIVEKKTVVKDEKSKNFGKENWQIEGYFGSLKHCFDRILDMKVKEISEKRITIEKFLIQYAETKKIFQDMFAGIGEIEKEAAEEE